MDFVVGCFLLVELIGLHTGAPHIICLFFVFCRGFVCRDVPGGPVYRVLAMDVTKPYKSIRFDAPQGSAQTGC